jgi:DNA-binding winged helix-turn-helix (wHTH) protein/Tol biopolymer transport system component
MQVTKEPQRTESDSDKPRAYLFGPFRMDLVSYELSRDGEHIALSPKAFDTLVALVANRERTVSKDDLMRMVWPDTFISEDSLTQSIFVARRALGDDTSHPRYITTIARRGYRFVAEVTEVHAERGATHAGDEPPTQVATATSADVSTSGVTADSEDSEARRSEHMPAAAAARPPRSSLWRGLGVALVSAAVVIVAIRTFAPATGSPGTLPSLRFTMSAPRGASLASGGLISPDGRHVAFLAVDDETAETRLWVRTLDTNEPRALAGTDGASAPFWSPDSRSLGFFADGRLKRIALDGSVAQSIAALPRFSAGSWGANDVILFTIPRSGLLSLASSGGDVTPVTTLDPTAREVAHELPQFLPDGQHFLYYIESVDADRTGTYLGRLGTDEKTRVCEGPAIYAEPGYLLIVRDGELLAESFDPAEPGRSGAPRPIASNLSPFYAWAAAGLSASNNGILTFEVSSAKQRLIWFDRGGRQLQSTEAPAGIRNVTWSPGGRELFASDARHTGLWRIDVERNGVTRVASDGMRPSISPDGKRIAFTSDRRTGVADVYLRPVLGGEGRDELLLSSPENKMVSSWSPDGRYLVFSSKSAHVNWDLWLLPRFGDGKPVPFLRTAASEVQGEVSPDGRWIAYTSDESGRWEVYVQSFPEPGMKQIVSIGGGTEPHWRRNGGELYYLAPNRAVTAVAITLGSTLTIGRPMPLFRAPLQPRPTVELNWYLADADGERSLVNAVDGNDEELVTVQANWPALLTP